MWAPGRRDFSVKSLCPNIAERIKSRTKGVEEICSVEAGKLVAAGFNPEAMQEFKRALIARALGAEVSRHFTEFDDRIIGCTRGDVSLRCYAVSEASSASSHSRNTPMVCPWCAALE